MLQATRTCSGEVFQSLAANFSQMARNHRELTQSLRPTPKYGNPIQKPDWLLQRPSNLHEVKQFNGRSWHFCTKCGRNGRWVCTHKDSMHGDSRSSSSVPPHPTSAHSSNQDHSFSDYDRRSKSPSRRHTDLYHGSRSCAYSRSRSWSPTNFSYSSETQSPCHNISWLDPTPSTPVANLSLLESLNIFLDDD